MINLIWGAICVWVGAASPGWDPREERRSGRREERSGGEEQGGEGERSKVGGKIEGVIGSGEEKEKNIADGGRRGRRGGRKMKVKTKGSRGGEERLFVRES